MKSSKGNNKQKKVHENNPDSKQYELEFLNFGPIIKGKLKLRNLTVIHGPNGSGKSYSASLFYNLLNLFNKPIRPFNVTSEQVTFIQEWIKKIPFEQETEISDSIHNHFVNYFFRNFIKNPYNVFAEAFGCLPSKLVNYKKDFFKLILRFNENALKFTLDRINTPNSIDIEALNLQKPILRILKKRSLKKKPKTVTDYISSDPLCMNELITIEEDVSIQKICEILNRYYYDLFKRLKIESSVFYLPASRTGIIQFRDYIIETMYKSITSLKGENQTFPMQINRDFLFDLYESLPKKGPRDKIEYLDDLLKEIENRVLKGNINRVENKFGNKIDYLLQMDKLEIDLIQSSSLITEIAPVIIYLRYHVKIGDFLFIEEPEAHLNLENQWLFAKLIIRCVRVGINIVLVTHSHYFISRINNFILAAQLSEKDRESVQLDKDYLKPEEFIINEFKQINKDENNQFCILNIDAKKDGIDFDSFNAILDEIGKEYHRIMDLLENKK